jgi:hypothetical protein
MTAGWQGCGGCSRKSSDVENRGFCCRRCRRPDRKAGKRFALVRTLTARTGVIGPLDATQLLQPSYHLPGLREPDAVPAAPPRALPVARASLIDTPRDRRGSDEAYGGRVGNVQQPVDRHFAALDNVEYAIQKTSVNHCASRSVQARDGSNDCGGGQPGGTKVVSCRDKTNFTLDRGCGPPLVVRMDLRMLKRMDLAKFMLRSLLLLSLRSPACRPGERQ